MKELSLGEAALHMAESVIAVRAGMERGLEKAARLVQETAAAEFGDYQPAVGPHPAWAELADTTKADRVAHGYTENEPLLRSGELRDSLGRSVDKAALEAVVGSTSDVMVYHEFGTSKMPARPVLGPAVYVNREKIEALAGSSVVEGLVGEEVARRLLEPSSQTS